MSWNICVRPCCSPVLYAWHKLMLCIMKNVTYYNSSCNTIYAKNPIFLSTAFYRVRAYMNPTLGQKWQRQSRLLHHLYDMIAQLEFLLG